MYRPTRSIPPSGVDVVLAVLVSGVVAAAVAASPEASKRPIWIAYAFAAGFGSLMFVRRQQPVLVVALTCLGLLGYYASGLPQIGLAIPVAAALYSAAEAGRLWAAVAGATGLSLYTYSYRIDAGGDVRFLLGYELATNVAVLAGAIVLGDSVRSRRQLVVEREEVIRRRETAKEADARRRVSEERLRIARELHDAVGHTVVALSLHTDAAIEALDADDAQVARTSMLRVREAATGTMRELRASVGMLRQPSGLADVEGLLEAARAKGVRASVTGLSEPELPAAVEETAYRIVQEATTNALRHADPRTLRIEFRRSPRELEVHVFNDGVTTDPAAAGHGLTGMRERAEALGGALRATRTGDGFLVVAALPLPGKPDA